MALPHDDRIRLMQPSDALYPQGQFVAEHAVAYAITT